MQAYTAWTFCTRVSTIWQGPLATRLYMFWLICTWSLLTRAKRPLSQTLQVERTYVAVNIGVPAPAEGLIQTNIDRSPSDKLKMVAYAPESQRWDRLLYRLVSASRGQVQAENVQSCIVQHWAYFVVRTKPCTGGNWQSVHIESWRILAARQQFYNGNWRQGGPTRSGNCFGCISS